MFAFFKKHLGDFRVADILLLVLINLIWGSTDIVGKFGLSQMTPIAVLWVRMTVALIAFSPVFLLRRHRVKIPKTPKSHLPFLALGACGFFINFIFHYNGLLLAPASHATALRITEVIFIVILSMAFLGEKIGKIAVAGIAIGVVGIAIVLEVHPAELVDFSGKYLFGKILILAGTGVEAFYTIIGKKTLKDTEPLIATALACLYGWLLLSITFGVQISREMIYRTPPLEALLACAYLGIFASAIGYWIYYRVLSKYESHKVGVSIMIQPVLGIPLAAIVLGEKITPWFVFGAVLIAAGVSMTILSESGVSAKPD